MSIGRAALLHGHEVVLRSAQYKEDVTLWQVPQSGRWEGKEVRTCLGKEDERAYDLGTLLADNDHRWTGLVSRLTFQAKETMLIETRVTGEKEFHGRSWTGQSEASGGRVLERATSSSELSTFSRGPLG